MCVCDKCGHEVAPENDVYYIAHAARLGDPFFPFHRHFIAVAGCEGSPSRAQYLAGYPRDSRYSYVSDYECRWRQAYEYIQTLVRENRLNDLR